MPKPENILEWHFVLTGPPASPYCGGVYHGILAFPADYPYKPPGILMLTPSGRFQPNTRICLSISDFHPETWNPMWSVSSILAGLLAFMMCNDKTYGSIDTDDATKRRLSKDSKAFNLRDPVFCRLYPELAEDMRRELREEAEAAARRAPAGAPGAPSPAPAGAGAQLKSDADSDASSYIIAIAVAILSTLAWVWFSSSGSRD